MKCAKRKEKRKLCGRKTNSQKHPIPQVVSASRATLLSVTPSLAPFHPAWTERCQNPSEAQPKITTTPRGLSTQVSTWEWILIFNERKIFHFNKRGRHSVNLTYTLNRLWRRSVVVSKKQFGLLAL